MTGKAPEVERERRFPWGFLVFATSPIWVTGLSLVVATLIDGWFAIELLGVAERLVVALAIGVMIVGIARVVRGGTRTHPAIRWLIWIPAAAWAAAALVDVWVR